MLSRPRIMICLAAVLLNLCPLLYGQGQCAGISSTPASAADCARRAVPIDKAAELDPAHAYSLAELIDIAELNNPRTHIVWERAKQAADRLGIAIVLTILFFQDWRRLRINGSSNHSRSRWRREDTRWLKRRRWCRRLRLII